MTCKKCGAFIPPGMRFCGQCGEGLSPADMRINEAIRNRKPPSPTFYIIVSIMCALLCFLPTAIPAIVFAFDIDKRLKKCDYEGAAECAQNSRNWCIISVATSMVLFTVCSVLTFVLSLCTFFLSQPFYWILG